MCISIIKRSAQLGNMPWKLYFQKFHFYAKEKGSNSVKFATSGVLFVTTILMMIGMVGFTPFLLSVMSDGPIAF